MTDAPLCLIAAGGTGGHMFPAQALAEELLGRGWRVTLSTDARGARYTGGFPSAVQIEEVSSATFARGGIVAKLAVPLRILGGVLSAMVSMRRDRPAVVVGFGGYPAIPAMGAAWVLHLPRMLHEQNGVLGRVNQLFAARVNRVACGTWPTELPAGVEAIHTGNPIRQVVRAVAAAPYTPPGNGPLHIALIGGSQAARILADQVPAALTSLPDDLRNRISITHQARPEDETRVKAAYAEAGIAAEVTGFVDVPAEFSRAQLIIARAGASTVADLTAIGRPAILVPLAAAIRDEQSANARALDAAGAAIVIREPDLTPEALAAHITAILTQPDRAQQMAAASLALGRPDAAKALADVTETLAHQGGRS